MAYLTEFPDYDDALPQIDGMTDQSWHNDAMPCLSGRGMVLWCDYADPAKREVVGRRFTLVTDDQWNAIIAESDSLDDILAAIAAYN